MNPPSSGRETAGTGPAPLPAASADPARSVQGRPLDPRLAGDPGGTPGGRSGPPGRASGAGRGDPGVPEALPRAVGTLLEHFSPDRVDRLWLFPPHRRGRREHGLVAASGWAEGSPPAERDGEGRVLATLAYRAEETGRGVTFESRFREEGEAPVDRLPRIMAGVVRRAPTGAGDPAVAEGRGEVRRLAEGLGALGVPWNPPGGTGGAGDGAAGDGSGGGEGKPQETSKGRHT